ncbi:MAG TPA: polysaccharide biosynthesis tyrosine autokinase [Acidimicrobiales bacterium]|nr:polysaccharide biosynthesis tyrosine autokinase [Acidimicrobiales bacterium]
MAKDGRRPSLDLRHYVRVLRRRKGVVAVCTLLVLGVSLALSLLKTPVYAAQAQLLLQPRSTDFLFGSATAQSAGDRDRTVRNELLLMESEPVRAAVRRELGTAPEISVRARGSTDVIIIRAESTDARRAATIANAYANAYISFRRQQAVDELLQAAQEIQTKLSELQGQIDNMPASPQKDALVAQQGVFREKLDQLQVDAALKSGGAQLVSPATAPGSPFTPKPLRTGVRALVVGLLFGIASAYFVEYLDDSVKSKEDIDRLTPGHAVIGLIPAVTSWTAEEEARVVSLEEPKSSAAEAYRTLRTSIQFLALEHPVRILQVTSPGPREGKTTTLVNLGVALARAGQRVIIVGCDLRRPRVHEFFDLENAPGLTSVLLGKVPLTAALQPVASQPRLSLLASGPLPPNPSELLSSRRTVDVLTSLQAEADVVLVDAPPVLPVTDAVVLSGRVDATLVVCVAGATTRKDLVRTMEVLDQVGAPVLGVVLNGVTGETAYGAAEGYYQSEAAAPAQPGAAREPARRA